MQQIPFSAHPVLIGNGLAGQAADLLDLEKYDKLFLLADSNTAKHCSPLLHVNAEVIIIEAGEGNKNLRSAEIIWKKLLSAGASRRSLLINLGGGMITDLGAFSASLFMRGISFVQVPTSLLAMVDAAAGGKSGVDLNNHKNSIGTFTYPELVLIDPYFLKTLAADQIESARAEMLKHALISDFGHARRLQQSDIPDEDLIADSLKIKLAIVSSDPQEKGRRKLLNFGHTFGHAFESLALEKGNPVLHGKAVAAGMICEAYLSLRHGLKRNELQQICDLIRELCGLPGLSADNAEELTGYMKNDKKSHSGKLLFSLLSAPGQGIYDIECSENEIAEALNFYKENYSA